ncbi:MAG: hypothetical protein KZQ73_11560, partial [Candidatus Thiodiazotropha sp. (ex Semelilucina semeliformis)]|nr:hypothetical protein [Candidatus Thiodiazotropha sp. (ex Semelilucina semeliformis)]
FTNSAARPTSRLRVNKKRVTVNRGKPGQIYFYTERQIVTKALRFPTRHFYGIVNSTTDTDSSTHDTGV